MRVSVQATLYVPDLDADSIAIMIEAVHAAVADHDCTVDTITHDAVTSTIVMCLTFDSPQIEIDVINENIAEYVNDRSITAPELMIDTIALV